MGNQGKAEKNALGAPKDIMEETFGIFFVRPLRIYSPFRQSSREVGDGQTRRAIRHRRSSFVQKVIDELQVRFPLVGNEGCILPGEAAVMLNGIMQTQLGQIKVTGPVGTIEEVSGELGDEEAKGRGKVEGVPDFDVEVFEGDVLPVVGQNAVVRHGVEHGAGGPGIALLGRDKLGPFEVVPCGMWRHYMAGFEGRREQIDNENGKVPSEDEEVDKDAGDFVDDTHGHWLSWSGLDLKTAVRGWGWAGDERGR